MDLVNPWELTRGGPVHRRCTMVDSCYFGTFWSIRSVIPVFYSWTVTDRTAVACRGPLDNVDIGSYGQPVNNVSWSSLDYGRICQI